MHLELHSVAAREAEAAEKSALFTQCKGLIIRGLHVMSGVHINVSFGASSFQPVLYFFSKIHLCSKVSLQIRESSVFDDFALFLNGAFLKLCTVSTHLHYRSATKRLLCSAAFA